MDLDTIQDLLGGSNLPPPPSVEDLLGDVIPIPASPSPPPDQEPSLCLYSEHSYSKAGMEGSGAVELAEPTELSQGSQSLAQLNTTTDCYEAFLLNLLRVYTQNKIESLSSSDSGGGGTDTSTTDSQSDSHSATEGGSGVFTIDSISPEAIAALSHGQVQTLVTSNSANYDVIHQILAFKQRTEGGGGGDETGEKGEVEKDAATSPLKQLQALQLTPDQLKQIQLQMAELIRTKQIVLPAELSMEQQQQLLQSLILKQIHSQNQHLLAPSTTSTQHSTSTTVTTAVESTAIQPHTLSAATSTATISSPGNPSRVTVGSTLAAMLRGNTQDTNNGSTAGGRAVKVEIQPHSNAQGGHETSRTITLQLGSTTVADGGSQTSPAATPSTDSPTSVATRSGGRKKKDSKDQEEPKKPSSPYGVFFSDVYPSVLQANPRMSFSEASKLISAMWNAMGLDTKKQYHERAEKLKETYHAYVASHKTDTSPAAVESLQAPPGAESKTLGQATQQQMTVGLTAVVEGQAAVVSTERAVVSTERQATQSLLTPPVPPPAPTSPRVLVKDLKQCINDGCFKAAVHTEFRGPRYCSNECVVQHCRSVFQEWVAQRKVAT